MNICITDNYHFAHKDQRIGKIDLIQFKKGFVVNRKYQMHLIDFTSTKEDMYL